MEKLSVKERKLLYYLSQNARESHTKIAKRVGIDKGTVASTIERFQKEGIIRKLATMTNIGALKATSFTLLLKFNKNVQENKEIVEYFVNHPWSIWAVTLSGNYDLFVEFAVESIFDLDKMLIEIRQHFEGDLNHYEFDLIAHNIRSSPLPASLYDDLDLEQIPVKKRDYQKKKLDKLDKKILTVLSLRSTLSLVDIAKEVGSTWDVVRYRIKLLERAGIILRYFPEVDFKKLGFLEFICKIELRNISALEFKKFEKLLKTNTGILYAFTSVNSFSILFHCAYPSLDQLDSLLATIQEQFQQNVTKADYYIVRDQPKLNLFPKGFHDQA